MTGDEWSLLTGGTRMPDGLWIRVGFGKDGFVYDRII